MAEEEDAWCKLAPYDKVSHANWKCRKAGYEELMKELPKLGEKITLIKQFGPQTI